MTRKVLLFLGKTGGGKSTLVKQIITRCDRVIIFDPMYEYPGLVMRDEVELSNYIISLSSVSTSPFLISYRGSDDIGRDAVFQYAWTLGNCLVVLEEAELALEGKNKYFNALIKQGRHRNVHLACISHSTPDISKDFRRQATSFFSFYQSEPSDLQHMQEWGFDIEKIKALEPELQSPWVPKEDVNYCVVDEKESDIKFEFKEQLSERGKLDL